VPAADAVASDRQVSRDQVRRALRHLTANLAPDEAGARKLLGLLDALCEEITDEAAEAVRSYLAESGARALIEDLAGLPASPEAPEPDAAGPVDQEALQAAQDPRDGAQTADRTAHALEACGEACAGHPGEGLGRPEEGHPGETRVCGLCGASFLVNRRHAKVHRFCSAACRSKARHQQRRAWS
jgi:hypothetical protein